MLGGKVSTINGMLKKNYRWKELSNANKRKNNIRCNNKSFGDPIRGR